MKKILIIDDSALMRRVLSDIIEETDEYKVSYTAENGKEGLEILRLQQDIEVVLCDINMPQMGGLELLTAAKQENIQVPFIMISSSQDASDTISALELGAVEFIKKPYNVFAKTNALFRGRLLNAIRIAADIKARNDGLTPPAVSGKRKPADGMRQKKDYVPVEGRRKLVALVSSTGGPRALQQVIPKLPQNLAAPVLVVQHMPAGFTGTLAARLNQLSAVSVKEAENCETILPGNVYIAKGGMHLTVEHNRGDNARIALDDSAPVVGLKPCGNNMYLSLCGAAYDEIVCVVLTGMGADGTKGIRELSKHNHIFVIAQNEESSTVYGMPRAIYESGLTDVVCDIHEIADEIVKKVGVL